MSGSFNSQAENNPNTVHVQQHVATMVAQVTGDNSQSQAEARVFIQENGAQVVGGHAPVNSPSGALNDPYPNVAPQYPPGLVTGDIQLAYIAPEMSESAAGLHVSPGPPVDAAALLHPTGAVAVPVVDAGND